MKHGIICETEITKRPLKYRLMPKWFIRRKIRNYEKQNAGRISQEPMPKVIETKGCKIFF